MFSRITACLALMLTITGCARLAGHDQIRLCGAALALIEGEAVQIREIAPQPATNTVSIEYSVTSSTVTVTDRKITCAFAGSGFSRKRLDLSSVENETVKLGDASLIFLKRLIERDDVISALENRTNTPFFKTGSDLRPLAYGLQVLIDAVPRASMIALLAASFSLICGLIGRMMFGIGEVMLIGSVAAFLVLVHLVDTDFDSLVLGTLSLLGVAIWAGIIFGLTAMRHIVEPLLEKGSNHLLIAGCGLMIAVPEFIRLTQGNGFRSLVPSDTAPIPFLAADGFVAMLNPMVALVSLIAMMLLGGIAFVVKFSTFGRNWTAYAEDPELAELIGVNRKALLVQTTALSVALAGAAGALIVLLYGGPDSPAARLPAIKAIMAGLIGRTRSVNAAVTAGFAIGILEAGLSNVLSSKTLEPTVYAVLAAALILRAWDDQCIPSKSHSSRGKE